MEFTAQTIAALVAAALSLGLELIPGLSDLWDKVSTKWKPLVIFGLSLLIPYGIVGAACLGVNLGYIAECPNPADAQLWVNTGLLGLEAFFVSQATFKYIGQSLGARVSAKG